MVGANDLNLTFRDSLGGDDTTAIYRYDTAWTPSMRVHGFRYIIAVPQLVSYDTNWVEDTIIVSFQYSWDNINWSIPIPVDTLWPSAAAFGVTSVITDADATVFGNYIRGMFVFRDSIEAEVDIQGNVYVSKYRLWVAPKN